MLTSNRRKWISRILVAAVGVAFFHHLFGLALLNPRNAEWVLVTNGDRAEGPLATMFYRTAPWSFPLGQVPNAFWPIDPNLSMMDGIPGYAHLIKLLLPEPGAHFEQFLGIWFLICFVLQAWMGMALMRRLVSDSWVQWIGMAFLLTAPVLTARVGHASLCAQWTLLAAFLLHFRQRENQTPINLKASIPWALLAVATASFHPYLFTMILLIATASFVFAGLSARHRMGAVDALSAWIVVFSTGVATFWVNGYLGLESKSLGFGSYSANLLSWLNPYPGGSRFLNPIIQPEGQIFEGFGYLGMGALLLIPLGCFYVLRKIRQPGGLRALKTSAWLPLGLAALFAFIYGLATPVYWMKREVLHLSAIYDHLGSLVNVFRASGRYVWISHYLLLTVGVVFTAKLMPRWPARLVLAAALMLQWADLVPLREMFKPTYEKSPLQSASWQGIGKTYSHLVMIPPHFVGLAQKCVWGLSGDFYQVPFAALAATERMAINSGQIARSDAGSFEVVCAGKPPGFIPPSSVVRPVYVVHDNFLDQFKAAAKGSVICGRLDGLSVCVPQNIPSPLQDFLNLKPQAV